MELNLQEIKKTLETWCAINTHSFNISGLDRFRKVLIDSFSVLEADVTEHVLQPLKTMDSAGMKQEIQLGKLISLKKRPDAPKQLLFSIHYDTVFETTSFFQNVSLKDKNTLVGPGVSDAKGGILLILKILEWLEQSPLRDIFGWEVVLNPDEESGSTGSKSYLIETAKKYDVGFVFEPSLPDGTMISDRKGSCVFNIHAKGKAAHVGRHFSDGENAILKLNEIIHTLSGLTFSEDVIFNIGIIQGGKAVNIVPDSAVCQCNIRTNLKESHEKAFSQIQNVVGQFPGTELFIETYRPPKPLTDKEAALLDRLQDAARKIGFELKFQSSGGVSDGNYLASSGLPVIDTLGPIGGNLHTEKEYVFLDSFDLKFRLLKTFIESL